MSQNQLLAWGLRHGVIKNMFQQYNNYLEDARNKIVRMALDSKTTHLLFLDTDIIVPPNLIIRMFKETNDPVVSGLYFTRIPPFEPVAYLEGEFINGRNLHPITEYPEDKLIDVDLVGMGCCLIDCAFLLEMYKTFNGDGRWFAFEPGNGEDVWFCNRVRKMGYKPKLHTGLLCGHHANIIVIDDHWRRSRSKKDLIFSEASYPYLRIMGKVKPCQT